MAMCRRAPIALTALTLWLAAGASAQTARYLALRGEGTASVLVDEAVHTAYITDGGHTGKAGIQGANIGRQSVLEYLLGKGVTRLVITCSHPHADHLGADSDEAGHPFRSKPATLSERSDEQGSWLIEVAALATGGGSVVCHAFSSPPAGI
jgi:beta-lactamase superfamily II metal-dependent hydrolase